MPNQTFTGNDIAVHARGSLVLLLHGTDDNGQPIDISTWTVRFEVDGVPLSVQLAPDAAYPSKLLLKLTRTQIASLKIKAMQYSIIDENFLGSGLPHVLQDGKIKRVGYVGEPDQIDEGGDA